MPYSDAGQRPACQADTCAPPVNNREATDWPCDDTTTQLQFPPHRRRRTSRQRLQGCGRTRSRRRPPHRRPPRRVRLLEPCFHCRACLPAMPGIVLSLPCLASGRAPEVVPPGAGQAFRLTRPFADPSSLSGLLCRLISKSAITAGKKKSVNVGSRGGTAGLDDYIYDDAGGTKRCVTMPQGRCCCCVQSAAPRAG